MRNAEDMNLNQRPVWFLMSGLTIPHRQTKKWPTQSCHLPQRFTKVTTGSYQSKIGSKSKQHVHDSSAFALLDEAVQ